MSSLLQNKTEAMKKFLIEEYNIASECIMTIEDPNYNFVFCFHGGYFIIGGINRKGDVSFERMECTASELANECNVVDKSVGLMRDFVNNGSFRSNDDKDK